MAYLSFAKTLVLNLLKEELSRKWGKFTGEHGFLYIIEHLVARGFCVEAMPIALDMELISLNTLNDIEPYIFKVDEDLLFDLY